MPVFVVETTYHLPVYRQRLYDAETVDAACHLAVEDEGWADERSDVDTSGETFVTGIWENADRAYQGTARMIPDAFRETIRRKADLFDRLVVLLRELAQPLGLSEVAFRRWLASVLAASAEGDAIQGRSSMLPGEPTEDMP